MVINPQSYVKLVRFDVTKENQITFSDGVAQVDYFRNVLNGIEASDFTYIRQENKIRFPYIIDEIETFNYLIVQNLPYNYITNSDFSPAVLKNLPKNTMIILSSPAYYFQRKGADLS